MGVRAGLSIAFLAAVLCASLAAGTAEAAEGGKIRPPLSGNEYVTLQPFVLPIVKGRKFGGRQYTLVLALKLADEDSREEVVRRTPKIRDALYPHLYRLVSFRRRALGKLTKAQLKEKLSPIALEMAGRDLVTALVVHEAFEGDTP